MIPRKRRTWPGGRMVVVAGVIFVAVVLAALLLLALEESEKPPEGERGRIKILHGVDLAREKWRVEGEKRLGRIETGQKEMRTELEALAESLERLAERRDEDIPVAGARDIGEVPRSVPSPPTPSPPSFFLPEKNPIKVFSPFGDDLVKRETADETGLVNWLPSGSFAPGVLLSGLDAPTGTASSRNPHPVLIHLTETARLANSAGLDIKSCRVTGAGYGQLSSERAYVRLERIACVLGSGDVVDTKIKGYVAGEDGKTGIRGRLVSKRGRILSRGILAGFSSGFGEALESSNSRTDVTAGGAFSTVSSRNAKSLARSGIGGGAGEAGRLLAEYYLRLAEEVFPVIEIDAGRLVDVIVTEGTELLPKKTSYGVEKKKG